MNTIYSSSYSLEYSIRIDRKKENLLINLNSIIDYSIKTLDWLFKYNIKSKILNEKNNYNIIFILDKLQNNNLESIITLLNIIDTDLENSISWIITKNDDIYRPPNIGLKTFLENDVDCNIYIGNNSGRVYENTRDDNSKDYKYALNLNYKFYTPEMFLNLVDKYKYIDFDTLPFRQMNYLNLNHLFSKDPRFDKLNNDIIILVGIPCVGKTMICNKFLTKYKYINSDLNQSYDIRSNKIVIDGCNLRSDSRKKILKKFKNVRCFYFNINTELAIHLNNYRMKLGGIKTDEKKIIESNSILDFPSLSDGFTEIIFVSFVPLFNNLEKKNLFLQHY